MERPIGVTLIAILDYIGAVFLTLIAIVTMVGGQFFAAMIGTGMSPAARAWVAGAGIAVGVCMLIAAAFSAACGYGLWQLRSWARTVTIVLVALGMVVSILILLGAVAHLKIVAMLTVLVRLGIQAFVIWYLMQPQVKMAFANGPPRRS